MDCYSEELSQLTHGFVTAQVNTCILKFVWGSEQTQMCESFPSFQPPKTAGSSSRFLGSVSVFYDLGSAGKEIHMIPRGHFEHPKRKVRERGRYTERNEKGGEEGNMGAIPILQLGQLKLQAVKTWPTTHHLAKANVSDSNGKAFLTHLSFRQKCHIASRYQ